MKTSSISLLLTFVILLIFSANLVNAQKKQRVQFQKGTTSTIVRGSLKGNVIRFQDYIVRAQGGQQISLKFLNDTKAEVVVFTPQEENLNFGNKEWSGELPNTGDYIIRVILNRAFARRNVQTSYVLNILVQ